MTLPSSLMTPRYTEMMRGNPETLWFIIKRRKKKKKKRKELKKKKERKSREPSDEGDEAKKARKRAQAKLCGIFSRRDDAKFGVGNGGFATPRNLPTTTSGEQNGVEETPYGGL